MFQQVEIGALEGRDHCFGLNNILHTLACATISNYMEQYALAGLCIAKCVSCKHISAKQVIHNRCTALRWVPNEFTDGTAILFVNASQPDFSKTKRIYSQEFLSFQNIFCQYDETCWVTQFRWLQAYFTYIYRYQIDQWNKKYSRI